MAQDNDYDNYVVGILMQFYGDVLKVSRSRGINKTLPALRRYIADSTYIRSTFFEQLKDEQLGQGLQDNAVLNSLIDALAIALDEANHKNNTVYADEIKKQIQKGMFDTSRREGDVVHSITENVIDEDLYNEILENPLEVNVEAIPPSVAAKVREYLLGKFEHFAKWSFHIQMGFPFQSQDFHDVIFALGQDIVDGKIDRAIITIPPRHSKTQTLSISLPLYSFCHNAHSHNIITSYADDVVNESSGYIRATMADPLFQIIFPDVRVDPTKRSLERWGTTKKGVMHAVPTGGKLTGKGAGSLSAKYSGVFVVDDAIKPKDAYSPTIRNDINDRYDNTFMSRLANDGQINLPDGSIQKCGRTPMVIIMQRVHDDDLVGYLLRGSSNDDYHWLNIPALVHEGYTGTERFYQDIIQKQAYTNAIPYLYKLEGKREKLSALWASRKNLETLLKMQKTQPYTFNSQYLGDPTAKGTGIINEDWWIEYDDLPKEEFVRCFMTADTASTKEDYSDYSVICYWGVTKDSVMYLIDIIIGKYEVPELMRVVIAFWKKHYKFDRKFPLFMPRALYMEDKSSGQYMNQQFIQDGNIPCRPVPRDKSGKDKIARFINTVTYFAQERIRFPTGHKHLNHIMREVLGFTGLGSGTGNDDVADNIADACDVAFSVRTANYDAWA